MGFIQVHTFSTYKVYTALKQKSSVKHATTLHVTVCCGSPLVLHVLGKGNCVTTVFCPEPHNAFGAVTVIEFRLTAPAHWPLNHKIVSHYFKTSYSEKGVSYSARIYTNS